MGDEVLIRDAGQADLPALTGLYGDMYRGFDRDGWQLPFHLDTAALAEQLAAQVKSRLCLVLAAELQGAICGFITGSVARLERKYAMEGGLGVIADLYVTPQHRRAGVARALLAGAEQWFVAAGVTAVRCDVLTGNRDGLTFWAGQGYGPVAEIHYKTLQG